MNKLPDVHVYAIHKSRVPPTPGDGHIYACPLYVNKARQVVVETLPLPSLDPVNVWSMAGTAMLLDPGMWGMAGTAMLLDPGT